MLFMTFSYNNNNNNNLAYYLFSVEMDLKLTTLKSFQIGLEPAAQFP